VNPEYLLIPERSVVNVRNILICLGATDVLDLIPVLIKHLSHTYILTIATTSSNKNLKVIQALKRRFEFKLIVDQNPITNLFLRNDLAIISASSLVVESILTYTPFIAIQVIENQDRMSRFLKKEHLFICDHKNLEKQIGDFLCHISSN